MLIKLLIGLLAFNLSDCDYNEKYRPQFHFSPPKGWLNDPNGLVYHNGEYELYYQYYPDKGGGPKYWGHARSTDLFHWQNLPVALAPTKVGQGQVEIWSGSAIVDTKNVAGYQAQTSPNKTIMAFFTGHYEPGFNETQWMAYSTDRGITWKFYDKNPVIPNPGSRDFRDPKVIEYKDHYVIVVTAGDRVRFYKSTDLKNWVFLSDFGHDQGAHTGTWECCDLFPLKFKNQEKWVLAVNQGGLTQYFVGHFDGQTFTNENSKDTKLWVDYGPDSYAGVTYNLAPDDRRIFISWVPGLDGLADKAPTDPWRGIMSVPRDLSLNDVDGKARLSSLPAKELLSLKKGQPTVIERKLQPNSPIHVTNISSNLLCIELMIDLNGKDPKDSLGLEFSGAKDSLRVYLTDKYVIDRSKAGRHDFGGFPLITSAPRLVNSKTLDMRIVLDVSSIELFADSGLTVMTDMFFSEDKLNQNIKLFHETTNGSAKPLDFKLTIHQLKSVWN